MRFIAAWYVGQVIFALLTVSFVAGFLKPSPTQWQHIEWKGERQ